MSITQVTECQTADDVRKLARSVLEKRRAGYKRGNNTIYYQQVKADIQKAHEPKPATPPIVEIQVPRPRPTNDPILANIKQLEIRRPTSRMREIQCLIARLDFLRGKEPSMRPSMSEIQIAVADAYDLGMGCLRSHLRDKRVVQPRHVAMALCAILTLSSTPMIGRHFGGRDHTTVLHALRKLRWLTDQLQAELSLRDHPRAWAARAAALYPRVQQAQRRDR